MEHRNLEISVISAKDLSAVNLFAKMDVYAYVFISGDPQTKQKTPVDHDGGKNPTWNFTAKFTIDESAAAKRDHTTTVVFHLKDQQMLGDKDIDEVRVPIKELLENADKPIQFVSYQVSKPSGGAKGQLNISYKFSEKIASVPSYQAPIMPAYTAPTQFPEPYKVSSSSSEPMNAYPVGSQPGYQQNSYMPYPTLDHTPYRPPDSTAYPPPPPDHTPYRPPDSTAYPPPPPQNACYPPQPVSEYGNPPQPPPPQYGVYPPPPRPVSEYGYPPQPPPPQYEGYPPHEFGYPPPQSGSYGYPPQPQHGYVYPPPHQTDYGYPPAQPGYGYPPGQ